MFDDLLILLDDDLLMSFLGYGDLGAPIVIPELPRGGPGRRCHLMGGEPHIVKRQRTEEEEEQLRLLKLLNDANNAKKLKRWQEAENESARQKHNKLLFTRLEREADIKKSRGQPDVKKANKEIAERRQKEIHEVRLANLEKARRAKK